MQIAKALGGEDQTRAVLGDLRGLTEVPKRMPLQGDACGFKLGEHERHRRGGHGFARPRTARIALAVPDVGAVRTVPSDERQRLFSTDPFKDRLEFVED